MGLHRNARLGLAGRRALVPQVRVSQSILSLFRQNATTTHLDTTPTESRPAPHVPHTSQDMPSVTTRAYIVAGESGASS